MLSRSLVRHVLLHVAGALSRGSDGAMAGGQAHAAVLSGAPGPGIARAGQHESVPSAIRADAAMGSQQVLVVEVQPGAGAATQCPHVLESPQRRAVLVDELHVNLVARLLGLVQAAQHAGPEHCGQDRVQAGWTLHPGPHPHASHCQRKEPGSDGALGVPGDCGGGEGLGSGEVRDQLEVKGQVRAKGQKE